MSLLRFDILALDPEVIITIEMLHESAPKGKTYVLAYEHF